MDMDMDMNMSTSAYKVMDGFQSTRIKKMMIVLMYEQVF